MTRVLKTGPIIQEVTNWTGKPVVLLRAPDVGDTCASKQKLMSASGKKFVQTNQGDLL